MGIFIILKDLWDSQFVWPWIETSANLSGLTDKLPGPTVLFFHLINSWVWPHPGHWPSLYLATFTLKSASHPVPSPALLLLYLLGLGILSVSNVSLQSEHPYMLLRP